MDYRRGGVWMRDAVLAVVLMSAVGAHIDLVHASGERRVRTVTVNAVGSAQAEPDVARLVYTVEVEEKSVAAARERGSALSAKILDAVKPENEKDIMTNRITTRPVHEWRGRRNYDRSSSRITVGYKYTNTVTITLRDLSMVADMTDRVLREGGDDVTLEKVHFELEDMEHVELAARTHAIAKARRYASTLAEGAAAKLGKVVSIQTQDGGSGPYFFKSEPMYVADMDMDVVEENSARGFAGSPMTPISAGTRKVEIGVFVEFELNF